MTMIMIIVRLIIILIIIINNNNNMYEYINIWIWFKTMLSCGDFIQASPNTRLQTSSNRQADFPVPCKKLFYPPLPYHWDVSNYFRTSFPQPTMANEKKRQLMQGLPGIQTAPWRSACTAPTASPPFGVSRKIGWEMMGGLEKFMDGVIFRSWWFPWDWSIGRFRSIYHGRPLCTFIDGRK